MIICAGLTAIALMTFYYFIPFFIVRGAPDSLGMLRPFLVWGSVLVIFVGFYWCDDYGNQVAPHPQSAYRFYAFQQLRC